MNRRPLTMTSAALLMTTLVACGGSQSGPARAGEAAGLPAPERIQHDLIGSDFPIARAVEVTPTTQMVWHSGMTPRPANPDAERFSPEYWGDTRTQALSAFARMEESLTELGLGFEHIVKMTVFLVPDPANDGRMDFSGFMEAYTQYFGAGADNMMLPARSAVGVAQLAAPGMLVEVEAVFARPAP